MERRRLRARGGRPPAHRPATSSTKPLIEIARAAKKDEALAGLERWKARHADVVEHLQPADILVDSMRGRNTTWTRIRVNLEHVPEDKRPAQEPLEVDYDPWVEWLGPIARASSSGRRASEANRQRARQPRRKWLPGEEQSEQADQVGDKDE